MDGRTRSDPEGEDPNNEEAKDNPVIFQVDGRKIRLRRIIEKFVSSDMEPEPTPNDWAAIQERNRQRDIELGLIDE